MGAHNVNLNYFNGRKRVIRIRIDNLMQAPEELSNPRRVVAAEREDSSWRSILAVQVASIYMYSHRTLIHALAGMMGSRRGHENCILCFRRPAACNRAGEVAGARAAPRHPSPSMLWYVHIYLHYRILCNIVYNNGPQLRETGYPV